jgi:DTW domain-containing protein YfiP
MSAASPNSESVAVADREPRPVCERCRRPSAVCVCKGITPAATRTRVLILQHPRERDVGIGTARLAKLSLANAVLRIDVDFSHDEVVRKAIASGRAHLLFPGPDAVDVESTRFDEPITLIVLDGTWWQAHKLLKANPALAALPRLRLTPNAPSLYGRVRREPAEYCVATIEAIAHVLGHLEGDPTGFTSLLAPFAAMVQSQLHFATVVASGRHRRQTPPRPPRDPVPALLRQRVPDIVCVHGEANAWPHLHPERTAPEIVHWLARRLATGETFEAVIAPRGRLAPSTCRHIRLDSEVLTRGEAWPTFVARFLEFLRPSDVLVAWGHFPLAALAKDGLRLPNPFLDARPVVSRVIGRRTGAVEDCVTHLGLTALDVPGQGRGGVRLANLCAAVDWLERWRPGGYPDGGGVAVGG